MARRKSRQVLDRSGTILRSTASAELMPDTKHQRAAFMIVNGKEAETEFSMLSKCQLSFSTVLPRRIARLCFQEAAGAEAQLHGCEPAVPVSSGISAPCFAFKPVLKSSCS